MLKRCSLIASLALAGCAVPTPRPSPLAAPPSAPQSMPAPGLYSIDASRSEVRLLVYRAGPLANFGHNHVMVNRDVTGSVSVGQSLETSSCTLSIPVDRFVIDDGVNRREEGEDFPGEISEDAKAGTLRNMLSAPLLNGAVYPVIEISSEQLQEKNGSLNATLGLHIAGHDSHIEVPFQFAVTARSVVASATFEVRQTELGLTPLSLLAGALQVRDALKVKLTLVATSR
jgi:hypothetical protein